MKVILKAKKKKNLDSRRLSWQKVRCICCNQPLVFPSFKKAREYSKEHGIGGYLTDGSFIETAVERID